MTTIDVCIPVHNGADYLRPALDSVLAQTVKPSQVFVSDNASDDSTATIVASYGDAVVSSRSPTFLPLADSINRALGLGTAEWLKPLCHDDLLAPECLETLARVAADLPKTVGLVGHGEAELFDNGYLHRPGGRGAVRVYPGRELLRRYLAGSLHVPIPAVTTALVRREAWEHCDHFDTRYVHCDAFCWIRLLTRWDYAYVDAPLSVNRTHGRQVAVAARTSLRSSREQDEYWNAFVDEWGPALRLSRRTAARTRCRGAAYAGAAIAIQLLKGDPGAAAGVVKGSPARWWPLLPPLTARAYLRERARVRRLRPHVPVELMYP